MAVPGRLSPLWGLVVIGAGLIPIAGAVFAEDSSVHAPRWVVAVAGTIFVCAGLMIVASPTGKRAGETAAHPGQTVLLAGILSGFAVVIDRLLLFTFREEWTTSGDFPLGWLPDVVQDVVFCTLLGVAALFVTGFALVMWLAALGQLAARLPGLLGWTLLGSAGALCLGGLAWIGDALRRGDGLPRAAGPAVVRRNPGGHGAARRAADQPRRRGRPPTGRARGGALRRWHARLGRLRAPRGRGPLGQRLGRVLAAS